MCVIIHQTRGTYLEKEDAKKLWERNPDGGGFAFIEKGEILTYKSMQFEQLWRSFEQARSAYPNREFVVHMRIATQGTIDIDNVHPFKISDDIVMAHNGHFSGMRETLDIRSDTRIFVEEVLRNLPYNFLDNEWLMDVIDDYANYGNKLLFLNADPRLEQQVYRIGAGVSYKGMWLSNKLGLVPKYSYKNKKQNLRLPFGERSTPTPASPVVSIDEGTEAWLQFWAKRDQERDREDLMALRKSTKPVVWLDSAQEWECLGCDGVINELDGQCDCYDRVCINCFMFCGDCICHQGYSMNHVAWDDLGDEYMDKKLMQEIVTEKTIVAYESRRDAV
jgi:hypothetical protein